MAYVVWIGEDTAGYFARCRADRKPPPRALARARLVWLKRFEGQGEALCFLDVAAAVAERLTRRREAARLAALVARRPAFFG